MNRFLLLILCLFTSANVMALGKTGHKLVCQLAYDNLTSEKQQRVDSLLAAIPKSHQKRINNYLNADEESKITFARSCVWADAIKKDDSYDAFKPWHFINVERDDTQVDPSDCKKDCITQAITIHTRALNESNATAWDKAQALMFLGHWLGDIHQPLHVSYQSDWGGNKIKLTSSDGTCTSLHWLWDSCLIADADNELSLLATLVNELKLADRQAWLGKTQYDWATESLNIARQPSVMYCHLQGKNCLPPDLDKTHTLAENYVEQHSPILQQRLLQAAVRLADLLERTL